MFLCASSFYCGLCLSPVARFASAVQPNATQMVYPAAVIIAMTRSSHYLVFTDDVLYPTYEYAPRLFAISAPLTTSCSPACREPGGHDPRYGQRSLEFFYRWSMHGNNRGAEIKCGPQGSARKKRRRRSGRRPGPAGRRWSRSPTLMSRRARWKGKRSLLRTEFIATMSLHLVLRPELPQLIAPRRRHRKRFPRMPASLVHTVFDTGPASSSPTRSDPAS